MKLRIFILVVLLLVLSCVLQAGIYTNKISGGGHLVVASKDATAAIKARADYICDGTDDQETIQAAINKAASGKDGYNTNTHGLVELSGGRYNITAPIYVRHGLTLAGAGPWSTNIMYVGTDKDHDAITKDPAGAQPFFVTVKDLGVWGKRTVAMLLTNGSGSGIDGSNWSDSKIVNCWAQDFPGYGFELGGWNCQLMYSCSEYNIKGGWKGGSEVIGCHSKYNLTGATMSDGCKTIGSFFTLNAAGISMVAEGADNPPIVQACHFNANYTPAYMYFYANTFNINTISHPIIARFNNAALGKVTADNSDAPFSATTIKVIYFNVVSDGGGNYHLDFYKTRADGDVPVFSDLIGHTGSFSGAGAQTVTADNSSGFNPTITIKAATYAHYIGVPMGVILVNGHDKWNRYEVNITTAKGAKFINNTMMGSGMVGTDTEAMAFGCIRGASTSKDLLISGNRIVAGPHHYYGLTIESPKAIVTDNHIVMLANDAKAASGINYSAATALNCIVKNNIIDSTAAKLTAGLAYGSNTDYTTDNIIIMP